jgi:hypothetical protein
LSVVVGGGVEEVGHFCDEWPPTNPKNPEHFELNMAWESDEQTGRIMKEIHETYKVEGEQKGPDDFASTGL